jgi:hypothetical protein
MAVQQLPVVDVTVVRIRATQSDSRCQRADDQCRDVGRVYLARGSFAAQRTAIRVTVRAYVGHRRTVGDHLVDILGGKGLQELAARVALRARIERT